MKKTKKPLRIELTPLDGAVRVDVSGWESWGLTREAALKIVGEVEAKLRAFYAKRR